MGGSGPGADAKMVIVGSWAVGKTTLMQRYCDGVYTESAGPTIGAAHRTVRARGRHLAVWDTAGSEQFAPLTSFYLRNAQAAMVCFDVTSRRSFGEVASFWERVGAVCPTARILLVGTKADRPAEVPSEEALALARQRGAVGYCETSALTGQGVESAFDSVLDALGWEREEGGAPPPAACREGTVRLRAGEAEPAREGCC